MMKGIDFLKTLSVERSKDAEVLKKPQYAGIMNIVTELYPDTAHFIYELLQNAEDVKATEMSFSLASEKLVVEHNGTRSFTERDIDSITSIGKSAKPDDINQIGKFGVGFKAVFSYTDTPYIYSGEWAFKIRDLTVPEPIAPLNEQTNATIFKFPFNNPKKLPALAAQEVEQGLRALGDNTLLFLSHIRKIEYSLPDGSTGSLRRIDHEDGRRIEIHAKHPGGDETISHWLHFQKTVHVNDDDGNPKTCNVAIAYSLVEEPNKKTEGTTWKIVPLDGQVSIYFPAKKEASNLRFHLHAPFSSPVARDSLRDCDANKTLRDHLKGLIVESLFAIRDQGMLTMSFLDVLPNPGDSLAKFYEPIRQAIVDAFKNDSLTLTRSGMHRPAKGLYRGPTRIANVLNDDDLSLLTNNYPPLWAANPPPQSRREEDFLDSLEIDSWGWSELANSIKSSNDDEERELIEIWLSEKDDAWLLSFYALLGEACSSQRQILSVSNLRIVKVEIEQGDEQVIPSQAYFPATEGITAPPDIFIVKKSVYDEGRSDEQKRLAKLFLEKTGVRFFDTKEVIKLKLTAYSKRPTQVPAEYMADIKMFVEYWQRSPNLTIDLFKNHTFLRGKSRDEQIHWHKPHELYLDKPFVDTGLRNLFNDLTLQLEKYKSEILKEYQDIPHFADFAVAIGVMDRLEIAEYLATKMQEKEFNISGRKTDTTVDKDYFLNYLEGGWYRNGSEYYIGKLSFKSKNLAISYAIWKTVCRAKSEQLTAHYVPNQTNRHLEKKEEAFFIKQLTNCAWLPDRDGAFLRPADVTQDTLHPDFIFDDRNGWLTAVKFGENAKKRTEEYQSKNKKAQEMGFEDAEQAAKFAELAKRGISPDELLAQQKRPKLPEESVHDPERHREKIQEYSADAPDKESVRRERTIQIGLSDVKAQAKAYLRPKYKNDNHELICQCCREEMPFKLNEEHYFEAVQCVKDQEKRHYRNYLAFCPICAAMYKHACETDDTEIRRLIVEHEASANASSVEIPVTLAGKQHNLRFVGTHWFYLKTILGNKTLG